MLLNRWTDLLIVLCQVIATDLRYALFGLKYCGTRADLIQSPIQPTWVSPNLKFEIDDAEAEWLYGDNVFDLVHLRYMAHAIRNWPKLYEQAYR